MEKTAIVVESGEALIKEGKIRYVNHFRKLSFINVDDSKHIAKTATSSFKSIIHYPYKDLLI